MSGEHKLHLSPKCAAATSTYLTGRTSPFGDLKARASVSKGKDAISPYAAFCPSKMQHPGAELKLFWLPLLTRWVCSGGSFRCSGF